MSDAIAFLETLGSNPVFDGSSEADYAAAVSALSIDEAQRRALLDRDPVGLGETLRARATVFCMIATPDREEHEEAPAEPDQGEEEGQEPTAPQSE